MVRPNSRLSDTSSVDTEIAREELEREINNYRRTIDEEVAILRNNFIRMHGLDLNISDEALNQILTQRIIQLTQVFPSITTQQQQDLNETVNSRTSSSQSSANFSDFF